MPLPIPMYGSKYLALEKRIWFRATDLPDFIFSTVRVFGSLPGLIISIRLSKIKTLIADLNLTKISKDETHCLFI